LKHKGKEKLGNTDVERITLRLKRGVEGWNEQNRLGTGSSGGLLL
jgi:hypothetical protein